MDAKGRTFRFRGTKKPGVWLVLVYVQGQKSVARVHHINVVTDAYGKAKAYCNCKQKFYRGKCHHEDEFYKYMNKLIAEGKTSVVPTQNN